MGARAARWASPPRSEKLGAAEKFVQRLEGRERSWAAAAGRRKMSAARCVQARRCEPGSGSLAAPEPRL
ncbi:hypothetical protein VULLAG_LOCUS9981 [Vulpes lagopus]